MLRQRTLLTGFVATLLVASFGCSPTSGASSPVASGTSSSAGAASTAAASEPTGRRKKVTQSAQLLMHPQLAQPGKGTQSAAKAKSAMTAAFKPKRKGRVALLQRKKGSGWVTVAKGAQNGRGLVDFTAPATIRGKVLTYRAFAGKGSGLGKVASSGVATDQWGEADFSDEFTGRTLGSSWGHRLAGYSVASKRKCSKADERAVKVGKGAVRLSVLKDPDRTGKCRFEGKKYDWRLNGHIGTQGQQSFTYGYAAARVKFQSLRGQHASFWMQPQTRLAEEGSAKETGAEIDVIEWFGNKHPYGGLTSFVYHYPNDGKPGVTGKKVGGFIKNPAQYGNAWSKKYHVFSVEWTPKRYIFRIDGKETFRTSKGVSGQPQYLILSLLSSDYELSLLGGERRLPQHMSVDWVRYWER